jgi:hypothetical protein
MLFQQSSTIPFTITVSGLARRVSLKKLPAQLPLALMLSLLLGYLAWLATANRMSFTWEIDMGIAAGNLSFSASRW